MKLLRRIKNTLETVQKDVQKALAGLKEESIEPVYVYLSSSPFMF